MKRLVSLDWLRGVAIISVLFFHALIFNTYVSTSSADNNIITQIILYFSTWAGIFAIISGFGTTISLYSQFKSGKLTRQKVLFNALITGAITLLFNYFYLIILTPGFIGNGPGGITSIGFFPALFWTGQIYASTFDPSRLFFATALLMIGWGTFFSGIAIFIIGRHDSTNKTISNCLVLGIIGTIIIFAQPFLKATLQPILTTSITNANYFPALILHWLIGPMDPIFPYIGFCFYGVIFGILYVEGASKKTLLGYGYLLGLFYTILGFGMMAITGGFSANSFDVPPFWPLISILGPMLLSTTLMLHIMDLSGDKAKLWWLKHSVGVRTFGIVSLSAFLLEGSFSQIIHHIFALFIPNYGYNLSDVGVTLLIFSPLVVILWWIILKLWARVDFKGSFEWLIIWIINKITGKQTGRLNAKAILFNVHAYVDMPEENPTETPLNTSESEN